ncbi:MAG TPA: thiamine-phosphate kinase [Jiangellaceae bacterium]
MPDNLADVGEFGLIAAIADRLPQGKDVLVGPGDDAAVVVAPDGRVVATTDMLVELRHFRRDWSSAYDVGRKAAAQNLSDVVSMGAQPTALLVALGAPPDLPVEWALSLADGLRDESALVGASVVGGDTVRSDAVVIAITALGDLRGREPVTRAGARPGDRVAVCGRLGWAEAGLAVLSRGFRSPRALVEAHRRPEVPYQLALDAVAAGGVTAMCDISDGLLADVGHIAEASDVAVDIDPAGFEVPAPMRDFAAALGADPLHWILTGGDDNGFAATFAPGVAMPAGWRMVGTVSAGSGVTVEGKEYEGPGGHVHFG